MEMVSVVEKIVFWVIILTLLGELMQITGDNLSPFIAGLDIALLIFLWFRIQKKWNAITRETGYENNKKIIQIMQIYRHNWLNHLQIILGYLSLKKYDRISKYIAKINHEAKQRSIIAGLKNYDLAVFLYIIPVQYPRMSFDLDVSEEVKKLTEGASGSWVLNTLQQFLDLFYKSIEENIEHHLIISLNGVADNIIANFEYEGNVKNVYQEIADLGKDFEKEQGRFQIDLYNEQEFIMELNFPVK